MNSPRERPSFFLRCAYDSRKRRKLFSKTPNLRRAVKEALASDDLDFFKSVGRVLSKEQVSANKFDDLAFAEGTKLENFLYHALDLAGNIIKPLCFLSMKELECFCHMSRRCPFIYGRKGYSYDLEKIGFETGQGLQIQRAWFELSHQVVKPKFFQNSALIFAEYRHLQTQVKSQAQCEFADDRIAHD